jgi:flavin reductase (DIM6/NTAB) family NADH-FMN oxidoreductase RutF
METGDHWLLYATVQDGKVLDDNIQSAVHFRKVGSNY